MPLKFKAFDLATAPDALANQPLGSSRTIAGQPNSSDAQVLALAKLFMADPGQKRTEKRWNAQLAAAAQARAQDMASRAYFSHTNPDGNGPNILVRNAGYPLASFYGTGKAANNIESISAGFGDAQACWTGWLNSPGHKSHVLGLIDFYRDQPDFGIGHVNIAGSQYGHYWVFIAARS